MTGGEERPEPPAMPDFSREDRVWNRVIFAVSLALAAILLAALALPHFRS